MSRKTVRYRGAMALVIALMMLLAACGGPDDDGEATPDEEDAEPTGNGEEPDGLDPDEAVELSILVRQEPRLEFYREVIPEFEAHMADQGLDVTVRVEEGPAPDEEFYQKLTLDFSAGEAADLTEIHPERVPDFAEAGHIRDITEWVEGWDDWDRFFEVLQDSARQHDGRIYTVPQSGQIRQLFYRADVLEDHGIATEQPQSWDDLLDRGREITAATGEPSLLFAAGEAWGGGSWTEGLLFLLLGTGSEIYDEDADAWVVRSEGLTASLGFYEDMVADGLLPVQPLLNPEPWVPTKYEAFPEGRLAVATCGTWCWIFDWGETGAAPIDNVHERVQTWAFPTPDGEPYVWGQSGWQTTISADSEHPEAAWEFLTWLHSPEQLARLSTRIGTLAPRDDLADVAPYSEYEFLIEEQELLTDPGAVRHFAPREGVDRYMQVVASTTENIISGAMSAQEAADFFAERATELLGEERVVEH